MVYSLLTPSVRLPTDPNLNPAGRYDRRALFHMARTLPLSLNVIQCDTKQENGHVTRFLRIIYPVGSVIEKLLLIRYIDFDIIRQVYQFLCVS